MQEDDVITIGLRPIEKELCDATIFEEPHKICRATWENIWTDGVFFDRKVVVYCRYCGYYNSPAVPGVDI